MGDVFGGFGLSFEFVVSNLNEPGKWFSGAFEQHVEGQGYL